MPLQGFQACESLVQLARELAERHTENRHPVPQLEHVEAPDAPLRLADVRL
jgi:hypothetical protein